MNSSGGTNFLGSLGQVVSGLSPLLSTGAQLYGQQNAGQAISSAANAGINTEQNTLGNINTLYQPQVNTGNGAFNTLSSTLGLGGQPANYANFLNMPGYQFAQQQGTQAIQRQAAAMGNAYTPNTAAAVGQYVTGTAMQDYNTYVQQLMGAAGFGQNANNNLGNINAGIGANIAQLQQNAGMGQAGMYTGMGQTIGGGLNGSGVSGLGGIGNIISGLGGAANGLGGVIGGIGSGLGSIANGISSIFGGGNSNITPTDNGIYSNGGVDQYGNNTSAPGYLNVGGDLNAQLNGTDAWGNDPTAAGYLNVGGDLNSQFSDTGSGF